MAMPLIPARFALAATVALACSSPALVPAPLPGPSAPATRSAGGDVALERPLSGDTLYDVVIRNGRVLDGAGNPWIAADVAIAHGRFVKIGQVPGRGRTEIDATGKYVSPGWIDMMDQSGSTLRNSGLA